MEITKELAMAVIKAISSFQAEFDGAKTKANLAILGPNHYKALKKYFPYMVDGLTLRYNSEEYKIIITNGKYLGLAFSFFTDSVLSYNEKNENT